ncbi:MAG: ribonuclease HII [Pseudohongiella sp.]|nr:ribonuclease HII [Pseudohongiella sp.]MDO9519838.1 ribonuclease HII [Pseudohongiella sp.]MDP2126196.1 ribonuclease HII [Pseudohongiella sp.]
MDYTKSIQSLFDELPANVADWPQHAHQKVAGADEAGRGPLAGAVFAAAVILPARYKLPGLDDSKKLSARKRELLYDQIQQEALAFAIAEVSAQEIDTINIFRASMLAMHKAVTALNISPDFVFVDGTHCPAWSWPSTALVKGDSRLHCIAAASILAKVARDRELQKLDDIYPGYGFAKHKGYPTRDHMLALQKLGPCAEHRRSYSPVLAALETSKRS